MTDYPRHSIRAADRRAVLARERCAECVKPGTEVDHILPVALGGGPELENLQLLCQRCHAAKTRQDRRRISKANRVRQAEQRALVKARNRPRRPAFPLQRLWKRKVDGTVVRRDA